MNHKLYILLFLGHFFFSLSKKEIFIPLNKKHKPFLVIKTQWTAMPHLKSYLAGGKVQRKCNCKMGTIYSVKINTYICLLQTDARQI